MDLSEVFESVKTGAKYLLTGATGFLGKIILQILSADNEIKTLSRKGSDINVQLTSEVPVFDTRFDIVIHSAGKAHSVPKTEAEKKEFFDVNVTGTHNLLKGLEQSGVPSSFIFISSVAVYGKETGSLICETDPLSATDPYGLSKIKAEHLVTEWCIRHNVICGILRLPLIAAANPPGNLAQMINGIKKGFYFNIAGGKAKKSIVLAKDVAAIIPVVAAVGGVFNLTDGYHPSFFELSQVISNQLGKSHVRNMPALVAKILGKAGDVLGKKAPVNSRKIKKIMCDLTFSDEKARKTLGWNPSPVLDKFRIA